MKTPTVLTVARLRDILAPLDPDVPVFMTEVSLNDAARLLFAAQGRGGQDVQVKASALPGVAAYVGAGPDGAPEVVILAVRSE
jgi:hypothetical protein